GDAMDDGYNAFAKVESAGAYQTALESLSGRALGSIGAFRFQGSRDFVSNLEQGCDADSNQADCAWGRVQVANAHQDETADALGYNADTQTIEAGLQRELRDGLTLGGALGYEHSEFRDADDMGSVDGDGIVGGIGLRYDHGPVEVSGVIDGGYGSYDSQRTVVVGDQLDQAKAKPDVWNAGVHLQASYTHDFGNNYLKPYAELRGIEVHGDGYTEQGASPFNLAVQSQSQFSAGGGLGAEWGTTHALTSGAKLGFYVNGAVEAGEGNDWTTRAHFADETADDSFTVHTNVPSTYGRVGLGMNMHNWKNVDLSVNYSTEFGGGYRANAGIARLAWHF
ncbi:MAG TPA: autotransporter outer membrane beta-barrel domain-containing protein, partial [Lysobacter sp.]